MAMVMERQRAPITLPHLVEENGPKENLPWAIFYARCVGKEAADAVNVVQVAGVVLFVMISWA